MHRRFKDPILQRVYDHLRATKPENSQAQGSTGNAYWVGRYRTGTRPFAQPGSPAYAAWCAGVDDARCAEKCGAA